MPYRYDFATHTTRRPTPPSSPISTVSGTVPDEPVINVKSGHLYERRLILKAIEQTGRDPVTDDETQPADLLAVRSAKVTKPRPVAASSVGGMLSALTNEFDALLLETNTLRNELEATRSELSQALYQHDAACRVIARVMKERDAARSALSAMQGTLAGRLGAAAAAADADVAMSAASAGGDAGSAAPSGLSDALVAAIKDKNKELTKMRKKRVVDPETAPAEGVRTLALARSFTPHAVGVPITALAATGDGSVITGGGDKVALLFDPSGAGRVTARLSPDRGGHTKRVTAVAGTSGSAVLLTGGADGAVKVWRRSSDGTGGAEAAFELSHSLQPHGQVDVVGIAAHSLHPLAVTAGRNGSWSIIDYDAGRIVTAVTDEEAGGAAVNFDSMALHPDGVLVAAGTRVATVRIFDVRTQVRQAPCCLGLALRH